MDRVIRKREKREKRERKKGRRERYRMEKRPEVWPGKGKRRREKVE